MLAVLLRGVLLLRPVAEPSEVRLRDDCVGVMEEEVPCPDAIEGGWGKAPMLMVLRTVLSWLADFSRAEIVLSVGRSEVECVCCGGGRPKGLGLDDGGLNFDCSRALEVGKLFRAGLCPGGRGGRADVGGSATGRDGTGRPVAVGMSSDMLIETGELVIALMNLQSS